MSTKSNRKHPLERWLFLHRAARHAMCEKAFTVVELMTVVVIIGVMLGITTIVWQTTARNLDLQSAAEMFKQDIRKVYSLAASGEARSDTQYGERHRDQYRMEIYPSNAESPAVPNTYKFSTRRWSGGGWGAWTPVTVRGIEAARILSDGSIKASGMAQMRINVVGSDLTMYPLIFEAKGSIVHVMNPATGTTEAVGDTIIRLSTTGKIIDITVSVYGDVS